MEKLVRWRLVHGLFYVFEKRRDEMSFTSEELNTASSRGYLDIVKYLVSDRNITSYDAVTDAAINGKLEIVQWLHDNLPLNDRGRPFFFSMSVMSIAAEKGRLNVVRWLHEHDPDNTCHCDGFTNLIDHALLWAKTEQQQHVVDYFEQERNNEISS